MRFGSCTKVINVNLNNANPNIVIEGNLNDGPGPYQVKLTQTVNFSDPNFFPPVTGAIVQITDVYGRLYRFPDGRCARNLYDKKSDAGYTGP